LGLTEECATRGWHVVATCRSEDVPQALADLQGQYPETVRVVKLDVADDLDIEKLAEQLADESIDFLVNNASAGGRCAGLARVTYESWARAMRVNAFATLKMTQVLVEQVARSDRKTIVAISSRMGSLSESQSGSRYAYRASKTAVNMVVRTLAVDLMPRGVTVVAIHPGWVRTSMGGPAAPLSVRDSASGVVDVMAGLAISDSGQFLDYQGRTVPW
jgi:NAD(P)-dependent dehydrogenase (short-subunit alcohol dehydrogenase family)